MAVHDPAADRRILNSLELDGCVSAADLRRVESWCYEQVESSELYRLRNDAKLRAVYTSGSYEEFKDIVDAAHLRPLDKMDKRTTATKSRLWNPSAPEATKEGD